MGCRLHHAVKYQVEWEGGWFNWNAEVFRAVLRFLEINVWDCSDSEDDYADFEMPITEFRKLERILKKAKDSGVEFDAPILTAEQLRDEGVSASDSMYPLTYHHLYDWSQEVGAGYDVSNDYIRFSWF